VHEILIRHQLGQKMDLLRAKGSRLNQLAGSPSSFCSCHSANRGTFVKELPAVGGFGDIFLAEWSQN